MGDRVSRKADPLTPAANLILNTAQLLGMFQGPRGLETLDENIQEPRSQKVMSFP